MKQNVFAGDLEAHIKNQQRPGLTPERSLLNKKEVPKSEASEEQKRAEAMLGTGKVKVSSIPSFQAPSSSVEDADFTKNYDQFKHLKTNRPVDKRHVNRLVGRIKEKNLLHLNPILVNREMEIIDGQHRLEAAKILKVAIYFVVDGNVSQDDIADMNSAKKNWQLADYLNFYANKGIASFVSFREMCHRYPDYNTSTLMAICSSKGKRGGKAVIEGQLDIGNIDQAPAILEKLDFFKKYFPLATSSRFIEAFLFILHSKEGYDHDRMVQKVEQYSFMLSAAANTRGYIQMLQQLYNKGVHEKNLVIYLKR